MSERAVAFVGDDVERELVAAHAGVEPRGPVRAGALGDLKPGTTVVLGAGDVASPHTLGTTETLGALRRGLRLIAVGGAGLMRAFELRHPGIVGHGALHDMFADRFLLELRWFARGQRGVSRAEVAAALGRDVESLDSEFGDATVEAARQLRRATLEDALRKYCNAG